MAYGPIPNLPTEDNSPQVINIATGQRAEFRAHIVGRFRDFIVNP